jgi:putative peptide zinc metalloprotease protein
VNPRLHDGLDEQPIPLGEHRDATVDEDTRAGHAAAPHAPSAHANGRTVTTRPVTASEFTSERMLRAEADPARGGWRRLLFHLTGGLVNLGPSPAELRERDLVGRVKSPVQGCRRIAIVSRKGGVGKTTTTLMLGHTFASLRGDRVIALDGNPDAGSLAYRVRRETTNTIMSLLSHRQEIARYADIRAYTSQAPTRLEVVAADDDPRITDALREQDFHTAVELLEVHYNLVCMDTGTGVLESAAKGILQLADQIVVVTAPSLDSARTASSTLDWLEQNGHSGLVAGAVAVINAVRPKSQLELDRVEDHFGRRCRAVIRVPWDPHLEAGAESSLERLKPPARNAYLELAAAVADGFTEEGSPGGRMR